MGGVFDSMARFCTLFSGSSGNSTYLSGSDTAVLVDAGRSCKQLLQAMEARQIDPRSLAAVLVTHEHVDHVSGLKVLLKKLKIPVYASPEVLEKLRWDGRLPEGQETHAVDPAQPFTVGSLGVECFDTPHDSVHSLGYRITTPDGLRLAVATDMGYISEQVRQVLTGSDLVLLESNYESSLLSLCDYPYYLKRRIASNTGHLSNDSCAQELVRLVRTGSTRLILGHLSENSNTPENAYQASACALELSGLREGLDYTLEVAPRHGPSRMVAL